MKNVCLLLCLIVAISCAEKQPKKSSRNIVLNDTITTESGLQYYFLKEGTGRKIEEGSKVHCYTDLFINDADTTLWSTAEEKDSIFPFVHRKTSLIKGFTELNDHLYEGDEVVAILPGSIAYGENGTDGIPPNATLIYKPYIVKYVSKPKEMLADSIYIKAKNEGAEASISFYKKVMSSSLKDDFHTDLFDMTEVPNKLNKDSLYVSSEVVSDFFLHETTDENLVQFFSFYKYIALVGQEKYEEALNIVTPMSQQELYQEQWLKFLNELNQKMAKQ